MVLDKNQQLKIAVYVAVIILLGFGFYYYYNYLQEQSASLDAGTQAIVAKKLISKTLNARVLEDQKFKDLQKITVEQKYLSASTSPSSGPAAGLTSEAIAQVPRRHANPFLPF